MTTKKDVEDYEEEATKAIALLDVTPPPLMVIASNDDLLEASAALRDIATKKRNLEDERKDITRDIDAAKRKVMDKFKPFIDELDRRETALRSAITGYQRAQAAKQREEQARLRDEQAKLVEAAEKKAVKLMGEGKERQAVAVMTNVPPVPTVVMDTPKTPGVVTRQTWKFKVDDLLALVLYAMESGNRDYILPNEKLLGELARTSKGKMVVPGVTFYPEDGLSVSRS